MLKDRRQRCALFLRRRIHSSRSVEQSFKLQSCPSCRPPRLCTESKSTDARSYITAPALKLERVAGDVEELRSAIRARFTWWARAFRRVCGVTTSATHCQLQHHTAPPPLCQHTSQHCRITDSAQVRSRSMQCTLQTA